MKILVKENGKEVDPKVIKKQSLAIMEDFDRHSSEFYTSGRLLDKGIINPRDKRKVLGSCLKTCW